MSKGPQDEVLELLPEQLEGGGFARLAADLSRTYYWSSRFEPAFYRAQARAGFIAVAQHTPFGEVLLPELQQVYALLDWENLRASHSSRRLLRPDQLASRDIRLERHRDPASIHAVLNALARHWGVRSWLLPRYRALMENLALDPSQDFALEAVFLSCGGELAAGELGYSTGRVYTSLSGFFNRERREWNGLGIVQLHLLARELQSAGYAFWNLGHPYMQYKRDLGARILSRPVFLARWREGLEARGR